MLAVRLAESAHWSDEFLCFRHRARVKDRQHNDFLAVNVFRKKRQWRSLAQHDPDIEFLRGRFYELTILFKDLIRLAERKDDQAGKYFRTHGKKLEFKLSDNAKIPASPTKRPEQFWVVRFTRSYFPALGRDHVDRDEVVDRHPVLAREPAEAAAERQAGNTRPRI